MKKASDPRHLKRIEIIEQLFALSFKSKDRKHPPFPAEIENINKNREKIENLIEKSAPEFPVNKISKIDVAILMLSVYELVIIKKEPPKVIIDEAIELAKEFGSESSPGFVNGVLGTIYSTEYENK